MPAKASSSSMTSTTSSRCSILARSSASEASASEAGVDEVGSGGTVAVSFAADGRNSGSDSVKVLPSPS
ncbi:MAG: hypothetical protein K0Q64_1185, partial [Nitrobacter vulgaris]|nr:hypothetical protein [Nitrobacter vulgaris]